MNVNNLIVRSVIVVMFGSVFIVEAEADPARSRGPVKLRTAPDASFAVIDVIPRGARVDTRYCISNRWCRVIWRGSIGWVEYRQLRLLSRKS